MAYNNGFPVNYGYFTQYQVNSSPVPQNGQNGIIWVQGEAGAKSYLVAPNNTVQLWDSESQTIYLKSADASGMPSMRVLEYTIRDSSPSSKVIPLETYATKEDVEALKKQVEAFRDELKKFGMEDEK